MSDNKRNNANENRDDILEKILSETAKSDIKRPQAARKQFGETDNAHTLKPVSRINTVNKIETLKPKLENENSDAEEKSPKNNYGFFHPRAKAGLLSDIMDIGESIILSVFIVLLIFTYIFQVASVEGTSMVPTLKDGDRLVVSSGMGYNPKFGDVVIINSDCAHLLTEDGKILETNGLQKKIVKRIIALPGQVIDFDFENGIVTVDGKALSEEYINEPTTRDEYAFKYPLTIPEDCVFVMGDNRNLSKDSRHPQVGLVPIEDIKGKVLLRMYPFNSFGTIK